MRYKHMKTLTGPVLNKIGDYVWAMPGGVAARRYIAENQIRFMEALLAESRTTSLRRELIQSPVRCRHGPRLSVCRE